MAALPLAYSVHPSVAAASPAELIALLKANPDKYSYGSPGIGTLHHLSAELVKKQTEIRMTHIPYKGAAPALTDLMSGQIPLAITSSTAALAQAAGGKLRVIGRISATLKTVLAQKELQDAYLAQGAIVEWTSPEELTARIARDIGRWRALAKEASIRAQ